MIPNRLLTAIIALTISAIISLFAQDTSTPPSWTSKDGRAIQAKFVRLDGEAVVIDKEGKEVTIPLAKLSAASIAQAKKLAGAAPEGPTIVAAAARTPDVPTYDPNESGPIEPLWQLPDTAFAELRPVGKKAFARIETVTPAGTTFLIMQGQITDGSLVYGAALLDGHSGKVISQTPFPEQEPGTQETRITTVIAADGRIVLCTVSWREVGASKERHAQVHLRAFDPLTGKLAAHVRMAFDDGKPEAESAAVKWTDDRNKGYDSIFCEFARNGNALLLATPYFVAEIDTATLTPKRTSRVPDAVGANTRPYLLATGAVWRDKSGTVRFMVSNLDGDAYAVPPAKPGWKVKEAMRGANGVLFVASESADKKEAVFGAFDSVKKVWSWTKPDPGWHESWSQDLGAKWIPLMVGTTEEFYASGPKETVLVNEKGEVSFTIPNSAKVLVLPEGKALVLPMEKGLMGPFKKELLLVDCASGAVDVTFAFHREFEYLDNLIHLQGNITLIAANTKLSVADPVKKIIPPLRKLAIEAPKNGLWMQSSGSNGKLCVLKLGNDDGGVFYGIPMPKR